MGKMNLFKEFQNFVQKESLFKPEHKVLLALSGGIDSMVLLSLLKHFNYSFEVAHANFQLREEESTADAQFILQYCKEHAITVHLKTFETNTYAQSAGIGTQEAARILRYNWFEELRISFFFDNILTAHHANDQAETIVFHLIRGAGSKGLSGIMAKNNYLVRPLLFALKQDIINHASEFFIPYRTDSSNHKEKYARNFIRHQIMPKMTQIQPASVQNIIHTGKIMEGTAYYFQLQMEILKKELLVRTKNETIISLERLIIKPHASMVLFELLKPWGFNFTQCNEIIQSYLNEHTGATFEMGSYLAYLNRAQLIIGESDNPFSSFQIQSLPLEFDAFNHSFYFSESNFTGFSENTFWIDLDLIKFPIELRSIVSGDKFKPLGLNNFQKVSDYLINQKVSLPQKKRVIVVHNSDEIYALLPLQVSNDFKVTNTTKKFLKIEQKKEDNV
jgi:tRNA(Ile)-lysidine synthase